MKVPECLHGLGLFPSNVRKVVGSKEYVPDVIAAAELIVTVTIEMCSENGFSGPARPTTVRIGDNGLSRRGYGRNSGSNIGYTSGGKTVAVGNGLSKGADMNGQGGGTIQNCLDFCLAELVWHLDLHALLIFKNSPNSLSVIVPV